MAYCGESLPFSLSLSSPSLTAALPLLCGSMLAVTPLCKPCNVNSRDLRSSTYAVTIGCMRADGMPGTHDSVRGYFAIGTRSYARYGSLDTPPRSIHTGGRRQTAIDFGRRLPACRSQQHGELIAPAKPPYADFDGVLYLLARQLHDPDSVAAHTPQLVRIVTGG